MEQLSLFVDNKYKSTILENDSCQDQLVVDDYKDPNQLVLL